jgi:NADPH-ferrihemoprotein reductase
LAGRLAKDFGRFGKKPLLIDPEEIDVEDISRITEEFDDPILLLFVATYGEGDPTDKYYFFIFKFKALIFRF